MTNNVCPSVVSSSNPDDTSQVALQWCTIPDASNPGTFDLYRKAGSCDGTNSSLLVDSIVAPSAGWPQNSSVSATAWDGNIWPTSRTCSSGSAPTVAVDLNVNPSPTTKSQQAYELQDEIALRNASRCS